MNEIVTAQYYRPQQASEPFNRDATVVSPLTAFSILWRRKLSVLVVGAVLSMLVVYGVTTLGNAYVASASVLVQERRSAVTDVQTGNTVATDSVAVRTQADILRSTDLARAVVQKLDLVDQPEFRTAPPSTVFLGAIRLAQQYGMAPVAEWLDAFVKTEPPTAEQQLELATDRLLGMTSIVNDGRSYVIDIKVKIIARSPAEAARAAHLSAQIANTYAEIYTQFTGKVKSDTIKQAYGFFDDRIKALRVKMDKAEHAVQDYRIQNNLIENRGVTGDGRIVTIANQQLAQVNTDLIAAASDRASKEASLEQVNAVLAGRGKLQSVPEIVASPLIQRLREQLVEFGAKEAGLASSRGAGSPDLVAVRAAQRDVAGQITAESAKIAASLRGSVDASRMREASLRDKLAQLQAQVGGEGVAEIGLRQRQNEADVATAIYSTYLKRSAETWEQLDMQEPDALVVSKAGVPLAPAPPSKRQMSLLGIAAAFMASGVLALVRERVSTGVRTGVQLAVSTGMETLGHVPRVGNVAQALAFSDSTTPFSEVIVSIRALLRLARRSNARTVMVTSALPDEGKTFIAAALARSAALAGERVLLIDCSVRVPAVTSAIGTHGSRNVDGVTILTDALSPLEILTLTGSLRNPPDLFASQEMRNLLNALRPRYDLIVLDAPAVLVGSDARVLSTLSDTVLMVLAWFKTGEAVLAQATHLLRGCGADIAGVVINRVEVHQLSRTEAAAAYGRIRA